MDRRTFLGAALVLVPGTVAAAPVRMQPVVLWSELNASISPGYSALQQVHLAVYADGTAIADTAFTSVLGRSTAAALARTVAGQLRRPARPHPHGPIGGATTLLEAWLGAHHFRGPLASPPGVLAAHRTWIAENGAPYAPDAVRLIVVRDANPLGIARLWPPAIPVPVLRRGTTWTQTDLTGALATAVARGLPHDGPADWRTYQLLDGSRLAATWRRLLPHELHPVRLPDPGAR
jgi:hypothetical protein